MKIKPPPMPTANNSSRRLNAQDLSILLAKRDAAWLSVAQPLVDALREIADDYADRFDLDDPSTNPGIKYVVKQAREAVLNACKEQQ